MLDQEFFTHYKQCFQTVYSSHTEEYTFIKDVDFRFQFITDKFSELLGINSAEQVIGKNYVEIINSLHHSYNKQFMEQLMEQDLSTYSSKKSSVYLEVLENNNVNEIYIKYKTPIINPETANCVGIHVLLKRFIWPHTVKTLLKMHGSKGLLINLKPTTISPLIKYPLTSSQHMVLFLCIKNYSYSEIALLLSEFGYPITPARVNDHLQQLKFIFNVQNKTQLIEKAIGLNFHVLLPKGLFKKFVSLEISGEMAEIVDCDGINCDGISLTG